MAFGALLGGYLGGGMLRLDEPDDGAHRRHYLGFVLAGYYFWKVYGSEIALNWERLIASAKWIWSFLSHRVARRCTTPPGPNQFCRECLQDTYGFADKSRHWHFVGRRPAGLLVGNVRLVRSSLAEWRYLSLLWAKV